MANIQVSQPQKFIGISTDTKPTHVKHGSTYYEHDTATTYITHDGGTTWSMKSDVGVVKEVSVTKVIIGGAEGANDVISESATNTVGTAWTFAAVARANGAYGYITKALIFSESENITPRLTLFLYNVTPATCELDDNAGNTAPHSTDAAGFVGQIDFPALGGVGTAGNSVAICSPSTVGNLPLAFKCASGADDLFGVLVTRDGFTQETGDDMTIVLTIEQY